MINVLDCVAIIANTYKQSLRLARFNLYKILGGNIKTDDFIRLRYKIVKSTYVFVN